MTNKSAACRRTKISGLSTWANPLCCRTTGRHRTTSQGSNSPESTSSWKNAATPSQASTKCSARKLLTSKRSFIERYQSSRVQEAAADSRMSSPIVSSRSQLPRSLSLETRNSGLCSRSRAQARLQRKLMTRCISQSERMLALKPLRSSLQAENRRRGQFLNSSP